MSTQHLSLHRLPFPLFLPIPKNVKLPKDNHILDHSPQTPNQPRQIRNHILPFLGMKQDPRTIRRVSQQTQQEEEET